MQYVLDSSQMKEVDRYSIEEAGIPSLVLMERAALSVCAVVEEQVKTGAKVLSVCGTGNNGADALACARILSQRGYQTAVCLVGDREHATKEFDTQLSILEKLCVSIVTMDEINDYDIIIDGIFGIGLSRDVSGEYRRAVEWLNASDVPVVAVDIPSGVDASSGKILGTAVRAAYTVTFGYLKTGQVLYPGKTCCGELRVAECGFVTKAVERIPDKTFIYDREDLKRLPVRTQDSNKGTYGNVLVFAGSDNMSGAAYFSAKAAYCMGAGLVRVMTVRSNKEAIQILLPEAVLCFYDEVSKEELLEYVRRAGVIIMGPGLSTGKAAGKILYEIFALLFREDGEGRTKKKVILDADALNIIARDKRQDLLKDCIITPHLGEMARLTGAAVSEIKERLILTAKEFSENCHCICVLKDARSVVSDGKQVYLNSSGNSGMSTAGSGDVLTGIIGGLLAGGMDCFLGAVLGTFVHGLAGDAAREKLGEYFMKADDIADSIKNVIYR